MRFIAGVLLGIVIALSSPSGAAEAPGQGEYVPGSEGEAAALAPGECSTTVTSTTFTVTNERGQTRVVTKSISECGADYVLVTRYRSPWTQ